MQPNKQLAKQKKIEERNKEETKNITITKH
jgi:hypothetical protein